MLLIHLINLKKKMAELTFKQRHYTHLSRDLNSSRNTLTHVKEHKHTFHVKKVSLLIIRERSNVKGEAHALSRVDAHHLCLRRGTRYASSNGVASWRQHNVEILRSALTLCKQATVSQLGVWIAKDFQKNYIYILIKYSF